MSDYTDALPTNPKTALEAAQRFCSIIDQLTATCQPVTALSLLRAEALLIVHRLMTETDETEIKPLPSAIDMGIA